MLYQEPMTEGLREVAHVRIGDGAVRSNRVGRDCGFPVRAEEHVKDRK